MKEKKALIIVDIQNDFLPKGTLHVKDSDQIIPIINQLQEKFDTVILTRDWHPSNHCSFASTHNLKPAEVVFVHGIRQVLWPVHCVENTFGSEFSQQLNQKKISKIISKGIDEGIDSYSAFYDNLKKRSTGLEIYLKENDIKKVYFCGLTTEYCVRYSVIDAVELGFEVYVFEDAIRPVNLKPADSDRAIFEMKQMGAHFLTFKDI
jgi:nicotinamidase/pyrazinamidase